MFCKATTLAVLATLGLGFLGGAEACNRASRRQARYVEQPSASTTPIYSGSGCVSASAGGCVSSQAGYQRVGIFRNGPIQRIHDRRQPVATIEYQPMPAEAPVATMASGTRERKCMCPDCKCGADCRCVEYAREHPPEAVATPAPQPMTYSQLQSTHRQVCDGRGNCVWVPR